MKRKVVSICMDHTQTMLIGGLLFKKAGDFILSNGGPQLKICGQSRVDRHVVYAHVIDGVVSYIGESSTSLHDRVRLYITHDGSTNVRVLKAINDELMAGKKVEVYYYKPTMIVIDGVLSINPYVGIEQALIGCVKPALNKKNVA